MQLGRFKEAFRKRPRLYISLGLGLCILALSNPPSFILQSKTCDVSDFRPGASISGQRLDFFTLHFAPQWWPIHFEKHMYFSWHTLRGNSYVSAFWFEHLEEKPYGSIDIIGVTGTPDDPGIFYLKRKGQGWATRYGIITPDCFAKLDAYLQSKSPAITLETEE